MPMQREYITRPELKKWINEWAEEYDVDPGGDMHFPFNPSKTGSLIQVFWDLYESGRVNSKRALKEYFARYARAVKS